MQLTAGSLTGRFGGRPKYWSERMLDDGVVHLLATDAHNLDGRPPLLAEGAEAAAQWVGSEEARRLVVDRPKGIWENLLPEDIYPPPLFSDIGQGNRIASGFFTRWLK